VLVQREWENPLVFPRIWKEMAMMNAFFAAALCSIVLGGAPVAYAYVYARRNGQKGSRRRYRS
jgi:hypothetical protein